MLIQAVSNHGSVLLWVKFRPSLVVFPTLLGATQADVHTAAAGFAVSASCAWWCWALRQASSHGQWNLLCTFPTPGIDYGQNRNLIRKTWLWTCNRKYLAFLASMVWAIWDLATRFSLTSCRLCRSRSIICSLSKRLCSRFEFWPFSFPICRYEKIFDILEV